jgi:hypothetical protein
MTGSHARPGRADPAGARGGCPDCLRSVQRRDLQHGVHGFGAGAFKPTSFVFLAAAPILMFNYEGFELPSNAAGELTYPQQDVPFAVLRSGTGTELFYGVPVLAILLVLPPAQVTNVAGFVDVMKTVFVVCGGQATSSGVVLTGAGKVLADIGAIGVIFGLLSSGVVWLIGSDRTQAIAGPDGSARPGHSVGCVHDARGDLPRYRDSVAGRLAAERICRATAAVRALAARTARRHDLAWPHLRARQADQDWPVVRGASSRCGDRGPRRWRLKHADEREQRLISAAAAAPRTGRSRRSAGRPR